MATSAAIAPLPAMPMSIAFVFQYAVPTAVSTPAAAAIWVTRMISGEAAVLRVERRARVEPEPAQPQDQDRRGRRAACCARGWRAACRPRRTSRAAARAAAAPRGRRSRRSRWTAVEPAKSCMPMFVCSQPPPKHPVRGDRVDEAREDDREDDVDAELDPLERRAPHDRQRDGAEDELEEPLRLDRGVGEAHHAERLERVAVAAQEEAVRADQRRRGRTRRRTRRPST